MKNVGKMCYVKDRNSIYFNEWGIIKDFDGDWYHVSMLNDKNLIVIFDRNEIRIPRK
jgi:hypothetical protein